MDTDDQRTEHAHWKKSRDSLSRRWAMSTALALRPELVLLVTLTLGLIVFSGWSAAALDTVGAALQIFITVILSVFAGLVGARTSRIWHEMQEDRQAAVRGRRTVRDLKLLRDGITSMKEKIEGYVADVSTRRPGEETAIRNAHVIGERYETLLDRCDLLEIQVLRAAREWTEEMPHLSSASTDSKQIDELTEALEAAGRQSRELQGQLDETLQTREEISVVLQNGEEVAEDAADPEQHPKDGEISAGRPNEDSGLGDEPVPESYRTGRSVEITEEAAVVDTNGSMTDARERMSACPKCGGTVAPSKLGISVCSACSHSWTTIGNEVDDGE